jgi:hypothetical protein
MRATVSMEWSGVEGVLGGGGSRAHKQFGARASRKKKKKK